MEKREKPVQAEVIAPLNTPDLSLDVEAGLVKGDVAETAKAALSENQGDVATVSDDSSAQTQDDSAVKQDREALKKHLLANAPSENAMRSQVVRVLEKQKETLESEVKKHRRKRDYHLMSVAIMQLRLVVHQLEEVAKASIEALRDMWIKVVHKFA